MFNVFDGCASLQSIIIPESVSEIGSYIINGCDSIRNVHYRVKNLDNVMIDDNAFGDYVVYHGVGRLYFSYDRKE